MAFQASAQNEFSTLSPVGAAPGSISELEREAFEILFGFDEGADFETGIRLLIEAAEAGSAVALDRLSLAYGAGDGVPRDPEEAVRLQRLAAEAGSAAAQFRVGMQYLSGDPTDADRDEGRKWLEASSAQGDRRALYSLAVSYLAESYEATDMDTVVTLLARSAELGEMAALKQLGQLLLIDPNRLDPEKGVYALELASASYPELRAEIGLQYFSGRLVERNPALAVQWLSAADADGNLAARLLHSVLLARGEGVERNPELAETLQENVMLAASAGEKNNIAWSLSVSPDPFMRDGALAVRLMESLLDSPGDLTPARLDTLAAAYAETGRFEDAVAAEQRAMDLYRQAAIDAGATAEQIEANAAVFRERLDLYRANRPYRQAQ